MMGKVVVRLNYKPSQKLFEMVSCFFVALVRAAPFNVGDKEVEPIAPRGIPDFFTRVT